MRRAVITGIGVQAPQANGRDAFWDLLSNGRSATRRITAFDPEPHRCHVAAEIDFAPSAAGLDPHLIATTDRATQLALVATIEALTDSGLTIDEHIAPRTSVALGSAVGATTTLEQQYAVLSDNGQTWALDPTRAAEHLFSSFLPSSIASTVAAQTGAQGPVAVISNGCTSGIDSVGYAMELIQDGDADIVITGAADAPISPITLTCFDVIQATSSRNDTPETACRPFDNTRTGLILGEGAATLILEEEQHAKARGAHIYGEVSGHASHCNAYHMTGLTSTGEEMAKAITRALHDSHLSPADIDYVNAHGSGTRQNDQHETAAVKTALGHHAYKTPMTGIKAMVGHSLGAIGSIEIAACALSMHHNVVVPTINLHDPDPLCDLDYVPNTAREHRIDALVTVGSGFGGFQSALVLKTSQA